MKDNEILQIFKSSESTKSTEFPYCQIALLPDLFQLLIAFCCLLVVFCFIQSAISNRQSAMYLSPPHLYPLPAGCPLPISLSI